MPAPNALTVTVAVTVTCGCFTLMTIADVGSGAGAVVGGGGGAGTLVEMTGATELLGWTLFLDSEEGAEEEEEDW